MKEITLNIVSLINLFGFCLGVLFALIILRFKKGEAQNKRILSALILSLCAIVLTSFLWTSDGYYFYPHLFKILPLFYLLIGPLLYFYLKNLTVENFIFKPFHLLHFIPFVVNIIFYLPYYLGPVEAKVADLKSFFSPHQFKIELFIFLIIRLVHLLIYLLIAFRLIYRYSQMAKNIYSSQREIKHTWMKIIVITFTTIFVHYFLFFMVRLLGGDFFNDICGWLSVWETLIIVYLSFKSLTQPDLIKIGMGNGKHRQITLPPEETKNHLQTLQSYMEKNKPYLNSILTIRSLSTQMTIPYWIISQIINESLKKNFLEFVNGYRIEEAKRLLITVGKEKNMLDIAYACGFNSKSAFNAAFKKLTGKTPSQYKQSLKKMS